MVTCVLATLLIGFAAGFVCSRYFRHSADPFSSMAIHAHHQLNRLADMNGGVEIGSTPFLVPNNKAPLNMLLNVTKCKNDNLEKNLDSSVENKTLQKVKKTYIWDHHRCVRWTNNEDELLLPAIYPDRLTAKGKLQWLIRMKCVYYSIHIFSSAHVQYPFIHLIVYDLMAGSEKRSQT